MYPPLIEKNKQMCTHFFLEGHTFVSELCSSKGSMPYLPSSSYESEEDARAQRRPGFQQDNWIQWTSHHLCPSEPKCVSAIQSSLACVHCIGDLNLPGTFPFCILVLDLWRPAREWRVIDLIKIDSVLEGQNVYFHWFSFEFLKGPLCKNEHLLVVGNCIACFLMSN